MNRVIENGIDKTHLSICRSTHIGRILSSAGDIKQIGSFSSVTYYSQVVASNGDRIQFFFMCDGTETKLEINTRTTSSSGKYDIYVNNSLDSSGYDDYTAGNADLLREVTLTKPIIYGSNIIEFRVNDKNALSTDYFIRNISIILQ